MEHDRCYIVRVKLVEIEESHPPSSIISVINDEKDTSSQVPSSQLFCINGTEAQRGLYPAPPSGMTEIPTCAVCLDRLDISASGVLTTLCNHTFHQSCLYHWDNSSCPVCRYRYLLFTGFYSPPGWDRIIIKSIISHHVSFFLIYDSHGDIESACEVCETTTNLWICLICANVGCGRYSREHAKKHYQETLHTYSLELATQRVWDYAGDG